MIIRIVFELAFVLVPLYGDDQPQQEARMVDLNVVAVDNHGQVVTDLIRSEFLVSDSGKPQTIAFFRHRDSGGGHQHWDPTRFPTEAGSTFRGPRWFSSTC